MIVKTVRDREKGQDGKLKNEKTDGLGGPSVQTVDKAPSCEGAFLVS